MFVKLTKLDGSPVWINASYVVTLEPGRGGSVVVPIGDGLDYDVREKPERILELLAGAPAPAVVPVPAVDALAPTRPDLLPEPSPAPDRKPASAPAASAPAKDPAPAPGTPPQEGDAAPKAKRPRRRRGRGRSHNAEAKGEGHTEEPKA